MLLIPFPFILAEILIFFWAVSHWGFFTTLGYYLLPTLVGIIIVSGVGRSAVMLFQSSVMKGSLPGNRILHSGAVFVAGLLLCVPSFFTRILGALLLLPGTRHLLIWQFKLTMLKKMSQGSARVFNFGMGGGNSGFRYYQYNANDRAQSAQPPEERDVTNNNAVLDVKPIEIVHKNETEDK